jgi:hypothetical protein
MVHILPASTHIDADQMSPIRAADPAAVLSPLRRVLPRSRVDCDERLGATTAATVRRADGSDAYPYRMSAHRVEASRVVAVEPTTAFDRLIAARLPEVFRRRYAAFPPVRAVTDEPDEWGTVGQTRTILLADGGRLRETLTTVQRPHSFAYLLDDIHGPLRPFLRTVEGDWSVTPEGTGARIGWAWTLHPQASPARLTLNVIGRMWHGYADRALIELETILMRA